MFRVNMCTVFPRIVAAVCFREHRRFNFMISSNFTMNASYTEWIQEEVRYPRAAILSLSQGRSYTIGAAMLVHEYGVA